MSSDAANADLPPVLPRPSIFISYASQDRPAARRLRDALEATGLDVWYDENELGGGDAWDQKIRRQIRECTYFLPVISAQTEARREGYFRREWRLAVDRSHDMADDVMFLLPVVIDGTGENGARVPEKFLTVQWLKLPGGVATPALTALAARLAHGDHVAPSPARLAFVPPPPPASGIPLRPTTVGTPASAAPPPLPAADGPPPMPAFPHRPAGHHDNLKYFAEVFWWILSTAWLLLKRLPKWVRIVLSVWVVIWLFSGTSKDPDRSVRRIKTEKFATDGAAPEPPSGKVQTDAATTALKSAVKEFARSMAQETDQPAGPSRLALVPFDFAATEPAAKKFGTELFGRVFGRLVLAKPGRVSVQPPGDSAASDSALCAQAAEGKVTRLVIARLDPTAAETTLSVRLLDTADVTTLWTIRYAVATADVNDATEEIFRALSGSKAKP